MYKNLLACIGATNGEDKSSATSQMMRFHVGFIQLQRPKFAETSRADLKHKDHSDLSADLQGRYASFCSYKRK